MDVYVVAVVVVVSVTIRPGVQFAPRPRTRAARPSSSGTVLHHPTGAMMSASSSAGSDAVDASASGMAAGECDAPLSQPAHTRAQVEDELILVSAEVCRLEMRLATTRAKQQFLRHHLRRMDRVHNESVYGAAVGAEAMFDASQELPFTPSPTVEGVAVAAAAAEGVAGGTVEGVEVAAAAAEGAAGGAVEGVEVTAAAAEGAAVGAVEGVEVAAAAAEGAAGGCGRRPRSGGREAEAHRPGHRQWSAGVPCLRERRDAR